MVCELDGKGNVKVFTFAVDEYWGDDSFGESFGESLVCRTTDYAGGWDWARQKEREIKENDPCAGSDEESTVKISYEYEWIPLEDWEKEKYGES